MRHADITRKAQQPDQRSGGVLLSTIGALALYRRAEDYRHQANLTGAGSAAAESAFHELVSMIDALSDDGGGHGRRPGDQAPLSHPALHRADGRADSA